MGGSYGVGANCCCRSCAVTDNYAGTDLTLFVKYRDVFGGGGCSSLIEDSVTLEWQGGNLWEWEDRTATNPFPIGTWGADSPVSLTRVRLDGSDCSITVDLVLWNSPGEPRQSEYRLTWDEQTQSPTQFPLHYRYEPPATSWAEIFCNDIDDNCLNNAITPCDGELDLGEWLDVLSTLVYIDIKP